MSSTYTDLGIELMVTGANDGTWGTKTNTNLEIINCEVVRSATRPHRLPAARPPSPTAPPTHAPPTPLAPAVHGDDVGV